MIIWDNARAISQKLAQDSSTSAIEFLDMMMNVGYKEVLVALERQVFELVATLTLTANQRSIQVPPDLNIPKTLVLIDGTTYQPLIEISSDKMWAYIRSGSHIGRPVHFHYKPRFGVGGGIIELDPVPSSDYILELTYEATERDLSKTKYVAGTVTLTNDSASVVGASTTFVTDMVGRYLRPTSDGAQRLPYRIKTFTNTTSIALEQKYHGTTQVGTSYEIFEMFALPEDCHMLPILYSNWVWWNSKGNAKKALKFEQEYKRGLIEARRRYSVTTRNNTIEESLYGLPMIGQEYPLHFPTFIEP